MPSLCRPQDASVSDEIFFLFNNRKKALKFNDPNFSVSFLLKKKLEKSEDEEEEEHGKESKKAHEG